MLNSLNKLVATVWLSKKTSNIICSYRNWHHAKRETVFCDPWHKNRLWL